MTDSAPDQKPEETPAPAEKKTPRPRRLLTVKELTARERALSDVAEQQKKKRREEQQAAWREDLDKGEFENLFGVFVDMHREIERLRAKGELTESTREQGFRIDHRVTEYEENLRLWKNFRSNIDRLVWSLGQKAIEPALEMLRQIRPESVAQVEQVCGKQKILETELRRIGRQILDEKHQFDEEVQSNVWEDRTIQNDIHQMVRRIDRRKALDILEEVRIATREPLEERLVRLKAVHSTLRRSLGGHGDNDT